MEKIHLCLWVVLVLTTAVASQQPCGNDYFILRNPASDLVLEANDDYLTLQRFTGFSSQQWLLELATKGQFYIVNRGTGKVLDVEKVKNNVKVVLNTKLTAPGDRCQKWYVDYGGSIISACGKFAIDIKSYKYTPGVKLEIFESRNTANQQFQFQYV